MVIHKVKRTRRILHNDCMELSRQGSLNPFGDIDVIGYFTRVHWDSLKTFSIFNYRESCEQEL